MPEKIDAIHSFGHAGIKRDVALSAIYRGEENNFRQTLASDDLAVDICLNGHQTPLWLFAGSNHDGFDYDLGRGNRRLDAILALKAQGVNHPAVKAALEAKGTEKNPAQFEDKDKATIRANAEAWQKAETVCAYVFEDVPDSVRWQIRMDKGQDRGYNRYELFLAVIRSVLAGLGRANIAGQLGISAGQVQLYTMAGKMPDYVVDRYFVRELHKGEKEADGKTAKVLPAQLTNEQVRDLYTAWLQAGEMDNGPIEGIDETDEQKAAREALATANPFCLKWQEITNGAAKAKPKALDVNALVEKAKLLTANPMANALAKFAQGETVDLTLFNKPLMTDVNKKKLESVPALEAENETLKAENETLKAENETLKAENETLKAALAKAKETAKAKANKK